MYTIHTDHQGKIVNIEYLLSPQSFGPRPDLKDYQEFQAWIQKNFNPPLNISGSLPNEGIIFLHHSPLLKHCKTRGIMLYASQGHFSTSTVYTHEGFCYLDEAWAKSSDGKKPDEDSGITAHKTNLIVPLQVLNDLEKQLCQDDDDTIRRISSLPIDRVFVYLDISDFSKYKAGEEALIINSLVGIVHDKSKWSGLGDTVWCINEAMLCIGDGYIFVFKDAMAGTYFAGYLAQLIEILVANKELPVDFHFRMGVHVGPVYSFWDPGRKGWNYIGKGINGGNRVLAAVGKEQDDVVFVSGEIRQAIFTMQGERSEAGRLLECLINRGRKADKHGNPWRVYELNHTALCGRQMPEKYRQRG